MAEARDNPAQDAAAARGGLDPDAAPDSDASSSQYDGEDFLFHLYRGSELLQDNCIEQAKEELERALSLQPRDVEGQGLLGVVYFRLGLYPRAIQIYEEIIRACPGEVTPRLNLALCYLKTGQHERSRELLEDVTRRVPDHKRAWGYLGLCFERIGDYAKALASFERAEQPHLARRMQQRLEAPVEPAAAIESSPPERAEVRQAAADAVQELEGPDDARPFGRAAGDSEPAPSRSGRWRAIEPGMLVGDAPAVSLPGRFGPAVPPVEAPRAEPAVPAAEGRLRKPSELVLSALLELDGRNAVELGDAVALVRVDVAFIARLDAVRALLPDTAPFSSALAHRRQRGRDTAEPLGAPGAPLWRIEGSGAALLRAGASRKIVIVELGGQSLYVRERNVLGFSDSARYESGRLATGTSEQVPMLMLAGSGIAIIELRGAFRAVSVSAERSVAIAVDGIAGWTGRLLPQPVAADRAVGKTHGFVAFSGDGAVWLEEP